jgi:hypothetical protein
MHIYTYIYIYIYIYSQAWMNTYIHTQLKRPKSTPAMSGIDLEMWRMRTDDGILKQVGMLNLLKFAQKGGDTERVTYEMIERCVNMCVYVCVRVCVCVCVYMCVYWIRRNFHRRREICIFIYICRQVFIYTCMHEIFTNTYI